MLRDCTDLGLLQFHPIRLVDRHGAVGEQVPHHAGLELPGGGDDLLRRLLGSLHGAEDVGDGSLLGDWWKWDYQAPKVP